MKVNKHINPPHLPVRVVLVVTPSLRGTMTLSYWSPAKVLYTTW